MTVPAESRRTKKGPTGLTRRGQSIPLGKGPDLPSSSCQAFREAWAIGDVTKVAGLPAPIYTLTG